MMNITKIFLTTTLLATISFCFAENPVDRTTVNAGLEFGFSGKSAWKITDQFLDRICKVYKITSQHYRATNGSIWQILGENKKDIHEALVNVDKPKLRELLSNPAQTNLYYGMDTIAKLSFPIVKKGIHVLDTHKSVIEKNLLILLETSGARKFWNYEALDRQPPLDIEKGLKNLDLILGFNVLFINPFPNEYGLKTSRGIIGRRVPMDFYHAIKVKEIYNLINGKNILEIGAGVGRTAYFSYKIGMTNYTIVDIPMSLVGSACYLAATLGEDAIWLEGEPENDRKGKISLISPTKLLSSQKDFDVVINIDSFTEMPLEVFTQYINYSSKHSKILYSVNHEYNQYSVVDIVTKVTKEKVNPLRFASALREGYVEEIYFFSNGYQLKTGQT